jgi:K+-sensing histidine kinase KdpD
VAEKTGDGGRPFEEGARVGPGLDAATTRAIDTIRKNAQFIPPPVFELLLALARHVSTLKMAVKLLEGRLALRDAVAEEETEKLVAQLQELRSALLGFREMDWGMRRKDHAIFQASVDVEIKKVERTVEAVRTWLANQSNEQLLFEREALEKVSVSQALRAAIESLDPDVSASRLVVNVPAELIVTTSFERLKLMMVELIDNALRYSPPDSPVEVLAGLNEDLEFWLEVADRGPGLQGRPPEFFWRPIQRREGADPTARPDGLSLGLYLVKLMVDSLNGALELIDRPGGGLYARVFLPQRRSGDVLGALN